jgi:molecular chaperone HscA
MGLLQIGQSKKRCAGRVAGIDLGTTHSLVAHVEDGRPAVLSDAQGRATLPSVVWMGPGGEVEVGVDAQAKAGERAGRTIASAKRFMGRSHAEAQAHDELSAYRFTADSDGPVVYFDLGDGQRVTPIEISAHILQVLRARAEAALGGDLDGAVITVPAYFDDAQRQATKDAARIAGIKVLRLINEPTAAALAYGLERRKEGMFAVFDLGGGTFDISILRLEDGVFHVLTTGGDSRLGGDDFDRVVAEYFLRQQGQDPSVASSSLASEALAAARRAKEALTDADRAELMLQGQTYELTRERFDQLIEPIVRRTLGPIRRVLKDTGIAGDELDGVVLVGGSTRVPRVRSFVAEVFGQRPLSDLDPDQVVALGAAVQADLLGGEGLDDDVVLLDVLPLSLGVETMGGAVAKLLHRNQTIPAQSAQEFTTYADGQTAIDLHVVQGEREMAADCRSLARFKLSGLPPMGAGMAKVLVTFSVDADGILHASAVEQETGVQASIEVKPSYGLDDATVERLIMESFQHADEDVRQRVLSEARVEGDRVLSALEKALAVDGQLLTDAERRRLDEVATTLRTAMGGEDPTLIHERVEALDEASADFAVRRMNESIRTALSGQRAESYSE